MRIELENNNKIQQETTATDGLADLIKDQTENKDIRFSELSGKKKAAYIWDYYKWWIIGSIAAVIAITVFIRDYRENSKPTYLYAEMLNTYFGYDKTNTLYDDFVAAKGIDLTQEHLTIGMETTLSVENYDTTMLAYQQRLVANYSAGELDVVIGPKNIMEGPANCDNYADFSTIIPEDLKEELQDRGYEFYYFDPSKDEIEDYEGEDVTPYWAGIYLDNCAYLNNMGEAGAYPEAQNEDERVIFTIAANTKRVDHAIEFLKFICL